jgi:hypothetical protein
MAVTSLKSTNTWTNSDGLKINYGQTEAVVNKGGEKVVGGRHWTEVVVNLVGLVTSGQTIVSETVSIPAGALIEEVEVIVIKETAGVNSNLDLGLVDQDRSTEIDFNGLLAAADAFNAGTDLGLKTVFNVGTTEAGALIGTVLTNTGYICANADTAVFTAGVLLVRVYWSVPLSGDL